MVIYKTKDENIQYPLNTLYFYLTKGCNLFCRHCWITPDFQTDKLTSTYLSAELFEDIIRQGIPLGLSGVKLTGGEPLLNPEIMQILEIVRQKELSCTIETNAVLCTPEIAALIASCNDPFVSVSLDGADAETHDWVRRVSGCYNKAIEGIKYLVSVNIKPQIIMTVMRHNKEHLKSIVKLAESLGCDSVKFNILQPTSRGEDMQKKGESLTLEELINLGRWVENELSSSTDLRLYFDHPLAFRPLSKIFGDNYSAQETCGIMGILGVLSDGSYALCGIGESIKELVFGNARSDSLEFIWRNNDILLMIREGLPGRLEGICNRCLMKHLCLGSCIAQNYYRSRSLFAPYYYCVEASKAGLFPETRLS